MTEYFLDSDKSDELMEATNALEIAIDLLRWSMGADGIRMAAAAEAENALDLYARVKAEMGKRVAQ